MARRIRTDTSGWDSPLGEIEAGKIDTKVSAESLDFSPPVASPSQLIHLPMVPLTAPGMPEPGPDFIALAMSLGDPKPKVVRAGDSRVCLSAGPELTRLYKTALYDKNFWMPVKTKLGQRNVKFIPGHRWTASEATGPKTARVMVIGKWPGQGEGNANRNFHFLAPVSRSDRGNSSKILHDMLRTAFGPGQSPCMPATGDLGYENWYVVNMVRFPNPLVGVADRIEAAWVKDCLPLLHMDIRLVKPDFILCLGSEASEAVLGKGSKVSGTFGKVFDYDIPLHATATDQPEFHKAKVMTCLHPAAVMHNPDQAQVLVDGMRNFVDLLLGQSRAMVPATAAPKDYRIIDHARDLAKLVEEAHADPEGYQIAVDCEWHGEGPDEPNAYLRTIQVSYKKDQAACIVLRHEMTPAPGGDWTTADPTQLPAKAFRPSHGVCQELLRKLFYQRPDGKKVRVIGHNFKADLQWLIPWGLDLSDLFEAPKDDPDLETNPDALPGWAKTVFEGGFDTMLAHHAIEETAEFKLEVICSRLFGVDRWDMDIQRFKKEWSQAKKVKEKNLEGYGPFPGGTAQGGGLYWYSMCDVDYGRQLFMEHNREDGLLDKDRFGKCSRYPFWINMRANPAVKEMEDTGLEMDRQRVDEQVTLYMTVRDKVLEKVRALLNWSNFNPNSAPQCRSVLFGPWFSGSRDDSGAMKNLLTDAKKNPPIDPEQPIRYLTLTPIKSTGKPAQVWSRVVDRGETDLFTPGTDKETLGILSSQALSRFGKDSAEVGIVEGIRQLRFVSQTLKSVLAEPTQVVGDEDYDEEFNEYEGGLIHYMRSNGRVHTHLYQTKETGRMSSSRPPLQNLSSKREADLEKTVKSVGEVYKYPLRSVIRFSKDEWGEEVVGCEHDLAGAELYMMAVQAGDLKMIEHCERNTLPEDGYDNQGNRVKGGKAPHPNYYDIHSSIAVQAFKLTVDSQKASEELGLPIGSPCPPTKAGLKAIKKSNLRKAAKTVVFGIPYGRGDEAILRAIEEEGVVVALEDVAVIRQAIFGEYPNLGPYLQACGDRVESHGFIVNCFGRRRRAGTAYDKQTLEALKRQFTNFPIQGGVADYISIALDKFHSFPGRYDEMGRARFRLALQIHDAILSRVRIKDYKWWRSVVVPECMTKIAFYRCDLDGNRISDKPYYMGCGSETMRSWGIQVSREEGLAMGLPEEYLPEG